MSPSGLSVGFAMGPVAHATGRDISPSGLHYRRTCVEQRADTRRSYSFRPEWGSNILALGTTKRLNVALKEPNKVVASPRARLFGPFRAMGARFGLYPERRCALPWAKMFKPVGLKRLR